MTNSETPARARIKTIETHICEVTVYSNQALVTRRGRVQLTGEEQALAIAGLPVSLKAESVRASGSGSMPVQLRGVRTERTYSSNDTTEKIAALSEQIKKLESQKRLLQNQIEALKLQCNFVQSLGEKSVERFASALATQDVGLNETQELLDFVGSHYTKYVQEIAECETQCQHIEEQLEALNKNMLEAKKPPAQESWNSIVSVAPEGSGECEIEISYIVNFASWTPLYDLRLNGTCELVHLTYLAEVKQNTGEDWTGVTLTLSTAKPGLGMLPPQFKPWYIGISGSSGSLNRSMASTTGSSGATSSESEKAALPQVSKSEGVVTLLIEGKSNIPSDGNPHQISIFSNEYPGRPELLAMPRLASLAYLQTVVIHPPTATPLLPGKANLFHDNTFVGTTHIHEVLHGKELKLNLGPDKNMQIKRDLVERQVSKKLIGGNRQITYAYSIKMVNLRDREIALNLSEQLPVSRNEQIKVRLTNTFPEIELAQMGLLNWRLTLPAHGKEEVYYQFIVEHPPDLPIRGLDI